MLEVVLDTICERYCDIIQFSSYIDAETHKRAFSNSWMRISVNKTHKHH